MKALHMICFILLVIGGLNWGLIGLGELAGTMGGWNVVDMLLGSWPVLEQLVYALVGLSALWIVFTHRRDCKMCSV